LHFGSLVAAVASALQAQQHDGHWFIRIDDIDPPREEAGATSSILQCLHAHGLGATAPIIHQQHRTARYREAIEQLHEQELVYACACSRQQWQNFSRAAAPNAQRCPGNCSTKSLNLDNHAVRFKVGTCEAFRDRVMGQIKQNLATEVGDFVLRRADGLYAYQLANVVDDAADDITEIVRGADLLDTTPRQIALARALGATIPDYAHIPTAVDTSGQKLSKQSRAVAMNPALALDNLHAAWDYLEQDELRRCDSVDDFWSVAVKGWDIDRISASATRVAPAEFC